MPSLADQINQNQKVLTRGPDGQLTEETQPSIQDLAQKAGLSSPPLTASGAAAIGANPQQTKMQGTPMQKNAALNIAAQAPTNQDLSTTIREQQARTQATTQEQGSIQKSEDMKNLGSLGDRVTDFIQAQKNKLDQQNAQTQAATSLTNASGATLTADQATAVQPLLQQLAADPSNMQLQLQVNQALGYDTTHQLSPTEIQGLYQDATSSIASSGAAAIQDNLTAQDLINQGGLGYDANQLSQLLGVPADQIGAMTVPQIRGKIQEAMANEFSQTQNLDQKAQSGNLGAAERALASQGAREASAVGTRSSEADVAHLQQQMQNAEQVSFGGKTMTIEQALSDDNISGTIADYLNAAPGSPQRTQLEQTEPQLVSFINKNQAVLADASQALQSGASQFQNIQTQNSALRDGLNPNLANALLGDNKLSASAIDVSQKAPLLQYMQQNPDARNILSDVSPEEGQQLASLNQAQVTSLLANGGANWKNYKEDAQKAADANQKVQAAASSGNPDDVINAVFNGDYPGGYRQFQVDYANEQTANMLGLPNDAKQYSSLGGTGGSTKAAAPDINALVSLYSSKIGAPSLTDEATGKRTSTSSLTAPKPTIEESNLDDNQQALWKKLGSAVDNDGKVDYNELSSAGLSYDQLRSIDANAPAFKGQAQGLFHALSDAYINEQAPDPKASLPDLQAAYADLLGTRDEFAKELRAHGGQGSDVINDFIPGLTKLHDLINQQQGKQDATKEAAQTATDTVKAAQDDKRARDIASTESIGMKMPPNWNKMSGQEQLAYLKTLQRGGK